MRNILHQFMKFGLVGVIASAIDFVTLTLLTEAAGLYYLLSAGIAFFLATIFNYIASMTFVFESKYSEGEKDKELIIFIFLSVVGGIINQLTMWFFVESVFINYIFAKIIATILVMIWNFVSRKIWIEG